MQGCRDQAKEISSTSVPYQRQTIQGIIMRSASAFLLLAAVLSSPVHARGDAIKFEGVQEQCVQVGKIKFGAHTRFADCSVTKGRWFATLDFVDMYQARYCLGGGNGECQQRALLVFSNRAYKADAQLMLQRIDAGAAEYDDPLLIQTKYGDILTLSAQFPDGSASKSYYLWRTRRWIPVDAHAWVRDLAKRLPKGTTLAAGNAWPDIDTMSVRANLDRAGSPASEVADVELALTKERFVVKNVKLEPKVIVSAQ
jgi:hypothetical protein